MHYRFFPMLTKTSFGGEAKESSLFGQRSINTGDGDDQIRVSKKGDNHYEITINGQTQSYTKDQLRSLTIDAGSGNDRIIIEDGVDIKLSIKGGSGDDLFSIYADGVTVDAGDGNDSIYSFGDGNSIKGGADSDYIYSVGHANSIDGGSGRDRIYSHGDRNRLNGGRDNDYLFARGRFNRVYGEGGNDVARVYGDANIVDSGSGRDDVDVRGDENNITADRDDRVSVSGRNNDVRRIGLWERLLRELRG